MKKSVKTIILILGVILSLIIGFTAYFFIISYGTKLNENKLINTDNGITFYDNKGNEIESKNGDRTVTKIEEMPKTLINAFISIEDKRFYHHNGVDYKGILRASANNLKNLSFIEGGSTITQQLVKNTHLSGEKTFKRKILEYNLAKKLEKKYSKDEILEFYLNTIYFGENCYGITSACKQYFNKKPNELNTNECAMLAGIVKAPSKYSPRKNFNLCNQRKNIVLNEMYKQNYINVDEYKKNIKEDIKLKTYNEKYDFLYLVENQLYEMLGDLNNLKYEKIKVYTTLNTKIQEQITKEFNNDDKLDKSVIVTNKFNDIIAYLSTCGDIKRNLGSTIKPLLCYAPAIEENVVYSCSKILDEKTNFNDFTPSNYGDKYLGNISVKKSLEISSNVCAVKLLNYTGINKCLKYLNKTEISTTKNDNNLSIALGSTEKGASLKEIACSYNVFLNGGNYNSSSCINKIEFESNSNKINKIKVKVFSESTIDVLNDMLKGVTKNGTAKKLSFCNTQIYAKTGTAGNKNGNTDAYCISYNPEYLIGVWIGKAEGGYIDNSITGGNQPANLSYNLWQNIYTEKNLIDFSYKNVVYKDIDKMQYEEMGNVIICDDNCPNRLKLNEIFRIEYTPQEKSNYFSSPTLPKPEISVNSNGIKFILCLTKYINIRIYRECDGEKCLIYDSINNKDSSSFLDENILGGNTYSYSYIPYYANIKGEFLGEEVFLSKIKTPTNNAGDNWWLYD